MAALPAPLQALLDLTFQDRIQHLLDDIVPQGSGERYDEGVSTDYDAENDAGAIQSPYRLFQAWCEKHCDTLQPYAYDWDLAADTAPEESVWRRRVTELYDLLNNSGLLDRLAAQGRAPVRNRASIMHRGIWFPWVSRTWRTLPADLSNAFRVVAQVRTLAAAARWVEHAYPDVLDVLAPKTFGTTTISPADFYAPLNHYTLTLAGWAIPIYTHPSDDYVHYLYDTDGDVYFHIQYPAGVRHLIANLLAPLTMAPRVHRIPALPSGRRFPEDLLESVASRNDSRTDLVTIASAVYDLCRDGFIRDGDIDAELAFVDEYRNYCREMTA